MNTNQWLILAIIIMTVKQCSKVLIALIHSSCGICEYTFRVWFNIEYIEPHIWVILLWHLL